MMENGEVDEQSRYPSLRKFGFPADFKFILIKSRVASDDKLSPWEHFVIKGYRAVKSIGISRAEDFGLETSNLKEELIPISIGKTADIELVRED